MKEILVSWREGGEEVDEGWREKFCFEPMGKITERNV